MEGIYDIDEASFDPMRLINAYFDDCISRNEFTQLQHWLGADLENARTFARAAIAHNCLRVAMQHADLRAFMMSHDSGSGLNLLVDPNNIRLMLDEADEADAATAREAARQAAADAVAAERRLQETTRLNRSRRPEPIVIPRFVAYLAAAALLAGFVLALQSFLAPDDSLVVKVNPAPMDTPRAPEIASITDSLQAGWADSRLGTKAGTRLTTGPLTLETGVVEITFDDGVRIVGEAPLALDVISASRVQVIRGKLVAKVPREAIGFTIVADAAAIVDLGTEFGVDVSASGTVGVHVLDGEVAISPAGLAEPHPRETLTEGVARQVSALGDSVAVIEFDRSRFIREVPASPYELAIRQSHPIVYWRFNEATGTRRIASIGELDDSALVGAGISLGAPSIRPDQGNRAASFAVEHEGIRSSFDDRLAFTSGFTLEAWVRTPAHEELNTPQRILSTFQGDPKAGFAFGLSGRGFTNSGSSSSTLLLFTFYGVYDCVTQVELGADQWVHVAAVIDDEGRPALYVDGECVPIVMRQENSDARTALEFTPLPVAWDPSHRGAASSTPLYIGRNPKVVGGTFPPECWQGAIDEVAVFATPLTAAQIAAHFAAGRTSAEPGR